MDRIARSRSMSERVAAGRATLLKHGWLAQTPSRFQEALFGVAIWKVAMRGAEFSRAGDTRSGLVGIASGTAEVSVEYGHPDARFVHLAHAGFWSGYRPLLGKGRNNSLVARTDVLWMSVPKRSMERLLHENPGYWRHITELSDMVFEMTTHAMADLTRQNGRTRVAGVLLRMAGCRDRDPSPSDNTEVQAPQADIAALAVMSRGTLRTYLAELARLGLIQVSYRTVRITNARGLRNLLDGEE